MTPDPPETPAPPDRLVARELRVTRELTDALFRQSTTAILGVALALVGFVAFQWTRQQRHLLIPWVALHAVALVWRFAVTRAYVRRRKAGELDARLWARRLTWALGFSGFLWGAAGALFFNAGDATGTAFLMIYEAGLIATVLIVLSSHLPAFLAFTLLTVIPLVAHFLSSDSAFLRYTGVATVLYGVLSIVAARRLHFIFRRSAELRFQNEDLAMSLQQQKDQVEAALLAKSKFLAAASHDLRQPLHALSIFVELLGQHLHDSEERAFLGRIKSSAEALAGLLNALLDISRMDAQSLQKRVVHFSLQRLFDALDVELGPQAEQKGLRLVVQGTDAVVESDPELLARVLRNLLSNAIRYTLQGEVVLAVADVEGAEPGAERRAEQETERRAAVRVSVSDTGPGIPLAEQPKVFEEFYQIGNPERDREKGLGLGLSIVRGLCQVLGHRLELISLPTRAVGVELAVIVPRGEPALARKRDTGGSLAQWAGSPLEGRRILVIDDESDIRRGMSELLGSWHCQAIVVASLTEALPHAADATRPIDLVICDYRLPGLMNGLATLAELARHLPRPAPAVIITGDTSPEEIKKIKSAGHPHLFKPVSPAKLRAVLTALLTPSG